MKTFFNSNTVSRAAANATPLLQAKLAIGDSGDALEQEADAVAAKVVSSKPAIQRNCAACDEEEKIQKQAEEEEEEMIQTKTLAQLKSSSRGGDSAATSWVEQQINSQRGKGHSLPENTRSFMESGIGANFENVKVHTDSTAVQLNRELGAKAFTVGHDIFFNSGQFSPETGEGKKLLAHELTHTVQQGASKPVIQRHAMAYSQDEEMIQKTENEEEDSSATSDSQQEQNPSCSHDAFSLNWADFTASVPGDTDFGAETHFNFTTAQVNGTDVIVANFLPASSWVKNQFGQADERDQNGCSAPVSACEEFMQAEKDANRTGATYNLSQPEGCEASVGPDPNATANDKEECESVLGTECDRVALLESSRLLRHEQYHYALACALAEKGTAAIAGGADIQTTLSSVRSIANTKTDEYDDQSNHGCDAAAQSTWETAIDNGLPDTSF